MDANLIARELEMTLLAKLLEQKHVDASSNLTMPASALLRLMRTYLGPEVVMEDLEQAAKASPLLTWTPYNMEISVDGISSREGVRLTVFRWNKYAANRAPFEQLITDHAERPRPPIAAILNHQAKGKPSFRGGPLGLKEVTCTVGNAGYGTQADVVVMNVTFPDWVAVSRQDNTITLSACPALGGVYRGRVLIGTNVNDIEIEVSTESAAFVLPQRNELTLQELFPDHPDLDQAATEHLLDQHLKQLKYERLPGGLFVKLGMHAVQERSNHWWLTETELLTGGLAAIGYPQAFTVYADADGKVDKYQEEVRAEHGQLGGGLADLLECLDAQVGQCLSLTPYQGGFKATLSPAEPWRTAIGHTFWLQGPIQRVLEHSQVIEFLLRRSDDKNITVNLLLSGEEPLPAELIRQHRAGRLTIRQTSEPQPYRLIVCDEDCAGYVPPYGPLHRPVTPPQALWESSPPLEGHDYRDQAWQRGTRGEGEGGLLDLELSVAMERLAQALQPAQHSPVNLTDAQHRCLLVELPRFARQLGVRDRPILATPVLERFGLRAEQVNTHRAGLRVTAGGYLTEQPHKLGSQVEYARYLCSLYGGVIHHSQLRKLVERFTDEELEPNTFVTASLKELGWAGYGYRRPLQVWEPREREMTPFTAEVLAHFETHQEALRWLRKNVAASEAQLERAITKAAPLAAVLRDQQMKTAHLKRINTLSAQPDVRELGRHPTVQPTGVTAPKTVLQAPKSVVRNQPEFAALTNSNIALPDPRFVPVHAVQHAVTQLIATEGPITETWLLRRYAAQTKINARLIQKQVLEAVQDSVSRGEVQRLDLPNGHVEYLLSGQNAVLRERGPRQVEDISFGEWCELLHALGLTSEDCDEASAHHQATQAYRFGTEAGRVRPLLSLALHTARQNLGARQG